MTRAKDISKIITDADLSGTLDVTGAVTASDITVNGSAVTSLTLNTSVNGSQILFNDGTSGTQPWQVGIRNNGSNDFLIYQSGPENIDIFTDNKLRQTIGSGGDISFYEDTGTTPKFFWDASAECLNIGTTSSAGRLNVNVDAPSDYPFRFVNSSSTGYGLSVTGGNNNLSIARFEDYAGNDRLHILGNGNVGIGTSSPQAELHLYTSSSPEIRLTDTTNTVEANFFANDSVGTIGSKSNHAFAFNTNNAERMRIDSNGNVGIGNTASGFNSQADNLVVGTGSGANGITIYSGSDSYANIFFADGTSGSDPVRGGINYNHVNNSMNFRVNDSPKMYILSSGNVGIGTSSPSGKLHVEGGEVFFKHTGNSKLQISAGNTSNSFIEFGDTDDGNVGRLLYDHSSNSMQFTVNASERMRINSGGNLLVGTTVNNTNVVGSGFNSDGFAFHTRSGGQVLAINRQSNDGTLISFRQDNGEEGTISVSGTTISYNGGHLSRWSQLTTNTRDESIVKGTVMTNLDQMAEWTTDGVTEDNEQLNCMAVSSVEGDANVAGVFVNWDNDDDIYTNDMNVAMTGDMVIRISQGTTVARGDLLMSAGDGTAKPQGDDIVRSKTIAKVTSTNVSHTYDDGTYLVPCVLMAC